MRLIKLFVAMTLVMNSVTGSSQKWMNRLTVMPRANVSLSRLMRAESPFEDGTFKQKNVVSFSGGFLIQYTPFERISFHAGYSWNRRGAQATYNLTESMGTYEHSTSTKVQVKNYYNTVPLFARIKLSDQEIEFFVDLGIYTAFLAKSNVTSKSVDFTTENGMLVAASQEKLEATGKHFTNSVDIGVVAGGGLSYILNTKLSLQLNPQISIGLRKLDREHSNDRKVVPTSSGFYVFEYDYFNLSSRAQNLEFSVNIGLNYKLAP